MVSEKKIVIWVNWPFKVFRFGQIGLVVRMTVPEPKVLRYTAFPPADIKAAEMTFNTTLNLPAVYSQQGCVHTMTVYYLLCNSLRGVY